MSTRTIPELPDWIISATKAKAVTGTVMDRAGRFLKENHKILPPEEQKILAEILTKPESHVSERAIPEFYYDSSKTSFWAKNDRGNWMTINASDVKRRLREMGYSSRTSQDQKVSEIDALMTSIQNSCDVDYAGPLAGYDTGVYMIHGKRVLVKDSPNLMSPIAGKFPILGALLNSMLGFEQRKYFDGWLKIAIESLYDREHRPGQALVLAGPPASGKSLLQQVVTMALGGRAGKPYRYMTKGSAFNGELFGCEHLMLEDEMAQPTFERGGISVRRSKRLPPTGISRRTASSCRR